jgi:nucleotidyltransferase substrate binding protein (TIGR01987 family)
MVDVEFDLIEKALASLASAISSPPKNDLERDGVIQRFEYSFELLWKTGKRVLLAMGVVSNSPRSVFRDLAQQGLLEDVDLWMELLVARNYSTHTYNESTALWVFSQAQPFLRAASDLLARMKREARR